MLKDKLSTHLIVGGMAVVGLLAGVATVASAQTATPTAAPATTGSAAITQTVDTPEPGDVADSPSANVSADQTGQHIDGANDTDGNTSSEASEPTGSSDASDQ